MTKQRPIAFVWENLGPSHHDRLRAVHDTGRSVFAVQLCGRSLTYKWEDEKKPAYPVATLADRIDAIAKVRLAWRIVRAIRRSGAREVFMCHYQMATIFLAAVVLRLLGCRVYTMLDSKFDDYPRRWPMTPVKALFLAPYRGAMIASKRSRDYAAYLGVRRTAAGYDTLDLGRLREEGGPPIDISFADRPFLSVSRLIPLKNLPATLSVFGRYRLEHGGTRRLVIVGEGEQEAELRAQARALGVSDAVDFVGAETRAGVVRHMKRALALILPSFQETFGFVVLEAMALGLPTIVSRQAGATDELVDNLLNGFVFDPHDREQLLAAMLLLDRDESLYGRMAKNAAAASERCDARHFVAGAEQLIQS